MIKRILVASMVAFVVVVACLTVVLGGCGRKGTTNCAGNAARIEAPPLAQCPAPTDRETVINTLGSDSSRVGRLETPVVADATVYAAEGGEPMRGRVTVAAGTWLVPADAFAAPDGTTEGESR